MPEALDTRNLLGTVMGALARISDDASDLCASILAHADHPIPFLADISGDLMPALDRIEVALGLVKAIAVLVHLDADQSR